MKLFHLALLAAFSISAYANGDDWIRQEEQAKKESKELEQQRMEAPTSTPIGGAQSGLLDDKNENQKEQMRQDAEKQKFLYEYEDNYRRGL